MDESTGLVKVSRKALLDPAETDALSAVAPAGSEADGGATYGDGGDGDDDGEFAPKFPVTPPKRYNRDFFRFDFIIPQIHNDFISKPYPETDSIS